MLRIERESARTYVRARRTEVERAGVRARDRGSRGSEREREKNERERRGGENESPRLVIVYQSVHLVSEVRYGEIRRRGAPAHWSITPRTSASGRPIAPGGVRARAPSRAARCWLDATWSRPPRTRSARRKPKTARFRFPPLSSFSRLFLSITSIIPISIVTSSIVQSTVRSSLLDHPI